MKRLMLTLAVALSAWMAAPGPACADEIRPIPAARPPAAVADVPPARPQRTAAQETGKKPAESMADDSEIRIEPLIWLPTIEGTFSASDPRLRASLTFRGPVIGASFRT